MPAIIENKDSSNTPGRILFNKRYINQIRANEKGDALYIDEDNNLYILEGNNSTNTPIPIVDKYGTSPDWLHGDHSSGKRNVFAVENLDNNNYVLAIQHKNMLGETSWEAIQVTSNGVIDWSTSDRKFENYEKYFNEDLDADGVIGINYTQIRNNESGDAIYIDKNNELYILDDNNTNNSFLMIRDQSGPVPN